MAESIRLCTTTQFQDVETPAGRLAGQSDLPAAGRGGLTTFRAASRGAFFTIRAEVHSPGRGRRLPDYAWVEAEG